VIVTKEVLKMFITWNEFKRRYPTKFESMLTRVTKEYKIERTQAIDILDEEYNFELHPEGFITVTNDRDGKYYLY
jgi:lipocalin